MRDPSRIVPLCDIFASFWQTYCPDLRFWQVISLITPYFENKSFCVDPFYAEEEDWYKAIQKANENFFKKTLDK